MIFFCFVYKTLLHVAAEKGNTKIVELLLLNPDIDINIRTIYKLLFFYQIQNQLFF